MSSLALSCYSSLLLAHLFLSTRVTKVSDFQKEVRQYGLPVLLRQLRIDKEVANDLTT